jgi:hypothetical protein
MLIHRKRLPALLLVLSVQCARVDKSSSPIAQTRSVSVPIPQSVERIHKHNEVIKQRLIASGPADLDQWGAARRVFADASRAGKNARMLVESLACYRLGCFALFAFPRALGVAVGQKEVMTAIKAVTADPVVVTAPESIGQTELCSMAMLPSQKISNKGENGHEHDRQ